MLNPDLKLNQNIFNQEIEQKPIRDGYGLALVELGESDPNIVVLTADLVESTRVETFAKKFPERFFEVGVAEQNMAAIAAGLAVSGKIPFISSYATFSPGKNLETIRTTIIYNRANVKIAGHHAGVVTGPDGATHQATEDLAITRSLPGLTIFSPCDVEEAKKVTLESVRVDGPVYLRFVRDKTPILTTAATPFAKDNLPVFWLSQNPTAVIFATGHLLFQALIAAKELEEDGIDVLVVNVATIKPLPEKELVGLVEKTGAVVTVEDHQVVGGLGGAIAEILARTAPAPIEFIGLQDRFAESGRLNDLIEKYNLGSVAIRAAVKKVIQRKK
ncbi:MAG: transketolase family protein [Patescibacteria group bacterium]|nr:transketolase family protein [Patescibacteria group bacterium]